MAVSSHNETWEGERAFLSSLGLLEEKQHHGRRHCEGLQRGDMGASGPSAPSDPLQQRELLS